MGKRKRKRLTNEFRRSIGNNSSGLKTIVYPSIGTRFQMPDDFEVEAQTTEDPQQALSRAILVLETVGFRIVSCDERNAELQGPGLNSTKQNPLLGATMIHLRCTERTIRLTAKLGGVATMQRFLTWFPWILGLSLGTIFALAGGIGFGRAAGIPFGVPWAQGFNWILAAYAMALLPVAPWLFLSPWLIRVIRNRTRVALETLLQNAVIRTKLL